MTKVKPGAVVRGTVTSVQSGRCINLTLTKKEKGSVFITDISDEDVFNPTELYEEGQELDCYVIEPVANKPHTWRLSLKESWLQGTHDFNAKEIRNIADLKKGQIVNGYVKHLSELNVVVWVGYDIWGHISRRTISASNDDIEEVFFPGKMISVRVSKPLPEKGILKLKLEDAFDTRISTTKSKSRETLATNGVHLIDQQQRNSDKEVQPKVNKSLKDQNSLSVSEGFSWESSFKLPKRKQTDSDEEDEEHEMEQPAKRKKSRFRNITEQLAEEKRLFETENQLMQSDSAPQSASDFDRLVMQSPDSSMVWVAYMAFFLESAEIDKARGVAERALTTISFREEKEKFNIWVAYMNLENLYGTSEQLKLVIDRALKFNDQKRVYRQLAVIYHNSDKIQAAEETYNTCLKKFKQDMDVWIDFGLFYYKTSQLEPARSLMQRSFKSLDKKKHVDVILKFAQMEFKYGELEKGKSMMEGLLSSYPKRTDLWAVFADVMVKSADIDGARKLFERAIHLDLKVKKMKFMLKKFLDFEEKHGTEESVEKVKTKAMEFIDSKTS